MNFLRLVKSPESSTRYLLAEVTRATARIFYQYEIYTLRTAPSTSSERTSSDATTTDEV
jgi:hypothetical protein